MEANYYNILNVGTALPIVFKGSSELYEHMYQKVFIHKCGNSFYEYSITGNHTHNPKYKYMSKGYKVMDIIHILATFDAEREYNKLLSKYDFKTYYQNFVDAYRDDFKTYERWSIEKFCDEIRKYFNDEKNAIYFYIYGEESKRCFLKLIKTIFFYNDAMQKLSKYRYNVFKITKLSSDEAEKKLENCILVAGGDFHKALYNNIEKSFCR